MEESYQLAGSNMREMTLQETLHSFTSFIKYLFSKWWLFLIVGVLAGVLGIWYATVQKVKYESRLTFSLQDNNGSALGGALGLAAEFGFSVGGSSDVFSGDNILEIITSRRIVQRVLLSTDSTGSKRRTFADYYLDVTGYREKLSKNPRLKNISFPVGQAKATYSYLQDSVLFNIYSGIKLSELVAAKPDKKLGIYELKYKGPEERFTKLFTDRLITNTSDFYTELRSKRSKQMLDVLEQRVAAMKGSLGGAITSRAAIQDANVNPAYASAQAPVQMRQSDITVYGAAYTELFKNQELARLQYLKDLPLLQIVDDCEYPMKKIKTGRLTSAITFALLATLLTVAILMIKRLFKNEPIVK